MQRFHSGHALVAHWSFVGSTPVTVGGVGSVIYLQCQSEPLACIYVTCKRTVFVMHGYMHAHRVRHARSHACGNYAYRLNLGFSTYIYYIKKQGAAYATAFKAGCIHAVAWTMWPSGMTPCACACACACQGQAARTAGPHMCIQQHTCAAYACQLE